MTTVSNVLFPGITHCSTFCRILGLSAVAIIILLYVPFCAWGIYRYYQCKDFVFMRKRNQWLTVFILLNLLLSLIFLALQLILYALQDVMPHTWMDFFFYAIVILAINVGWKMTWRLFMIYFDTKWAYAIKNKEWQSLIDHSLAQRDADWFLANRDKYGQWHSFVAYYLAVVALDVFLITLWEYALPAQLERYKLSILTLTIVVLAAVPISIIAYLRFKTPSFDDNFAVRDEAKFALLVTNVGALLIALIWFVSSLFVDPEAQVIGTILIHFVWSTIYVAVLYLSTIWVIARNRQWMLITSKTPKDLLTMFKVRDRTPTLSLTPAMQQSSSNSHSGCTTETEIPKQIGLSQVIYLDICLKVS